MFEEQKELVLDDYENEILEAYESGKLVPSHSQTDFQAIAENTMRKNRINEVNIRVNSCVSVVSKAFPKPCNSLNSSHKC
jgi:hypothetical protein